MRRTQHLLSLSVLLIFALLFYASTGPRKVQADIREPIKTPNYDYSPPEAQTRANLTLAFIQPSFARSMQYWDCKLFRDFADHMNTDFQEMITKRGFTLRGPFLLPDDMVYNDKQACYLYVQPEIEIAFDISNVTEHQHTESNYTYGAPATYTTVYWFDGTITLSGRINLYFSEPFTKEKIKAAAISIPPKSVDIKSTVSYTNRNFFRAIQRHEDPGLINPLITALEDCYQACFTTAYNHFEPQEIERYISDAKAARDGKR